MTKSRTNYLCPWEVLGKMHGFYKQWSISITKKSLTTKMRSKPLKQLKGLKDNEFIDNKLNYYLKSTEAASLRFYSLSRIKPEVIVLFHIVAFH